MKHGTVTTHDYGQPWDDGDIEALLELWDQGLTIREIAERMGRTYGGVKSKLFRMRHAA